MKSLRFATKRVKHGSAGTECRLTVRTARAECHRERELAVTTAGVWREPVLQSCAKKRHEKPTRYRARGRPDTRVWGVRARQTRSPPPFYWSSSARVAATASPPPPHERRERRGRAPLPRAPTADDDDGATRFPHTRSPSASHGNRSSSPFPLSLSPDFDPGFLKYLLLSAFLRRRRRHFPTPVVDRTHRPIRYTWTTIGVYDSVGAPPLFRSVSAVGFSLRAIFTTVFRRSRFGSPVGLRLRRRRRWHRRSSPRSRRLGVCTVLRTPPLLSSRLGVRRSRRNGQGKRRRFDCDYFN